MSEHHTHNSKALLKVCIMFSIFMVIEFVVAIFSDSLTLMADAGHLLTDNIAIIFSMLAIKISKKPADEKKSFGYHRFKILATFVNGFSLLLISIYIIFEAIFRIWHPVELNGYTLVFMGISGTILNIIAFLTLKKSDHNHDLNMQSALLHVLSDMVGFIAALVAGIVIIITKKYIIDPILSIFIAGLFLHTTWRLIKESVHILLEGSPLHVNIDELHQEIKNRIPVIDNIHHTHMWSISDEEHCITMHLVIKNPENHVDALNKIRSILKDKYNFGHTTIQIETKECEESDIK